MLPVLTNALDRKWAAGNIERRAETAGKDEQIRMLEREHNCAKASHGNARYRPMSAVTGGREPVFNVSYEVMHDVIFVTVLRTVG